MSGIWGVRVWIVQLAVRHLAGANEVDVVISVESDSVAKPMCSHV